ncbi:leucyl aminopeptidase family protein [Nitratireductor pacificus]|uniref:Peptidase M17 leucyl aminopeptidase domain-containing protein n=1 Tax=Nitratireductor pacificus pht-3B TaxID=391937 RepID=K2MQ93_9HYPH|nr:M17 family metallopeptidase [Nitratireductor pacificus]EKF19477.1 peptidase M17 leucyl aminopeptidase domain-containing protein [Nitratireductor pacificus pht-3B]
MPLTLVARKEENSLPVYPVQAGRLEAVAAPPEALAWARMHGFNGAAGKVLTIPGKDAALAGAFIGIGEEGEMTALTSGGLARHLPEGAWHFATAPDEAELAALGLMLGSYAFTRYGKKPLPEIRFAVPHGVDAARVGHLAEGSFLARDLINTPAGDMGPDRLEAAARALAERHGAKVSVIEGDALLDANLPMIHAVGRASAIAPRLIDLTWGTPDAPKVTLVGKGVCFDTGGLDLKPAAGMLLMKKDMGGAANVLGLALMLMASKARIRLRVLIPAVENAVSGNAFRPGDVLTSRKGLTVEIGNTDAEGRLVLADALALADEEAPEMLIDMATLTGAARVALGPDLPPFYTDDDILADALARASMAVADPLWRMPLWKPYRARLDSKIADMNNVSLDGFAGSPIAGLFLGRFVEQAKSWVHLDIFGWNPTDKPHAPVGGEAQGIRALERVLADRYGG